MHEFNLLFLPYPECFNFHEILTQLSIVNSELSLLANQNCSSTDISKYISVGFSGLTLV